MQAESVFENATDRLETTATVWLGLTMNCARCHDHKFDPISSREYYEMLAFFDKQQGLRPGLVVRLARFFRSRQVDVVYTHHVGPLLYAGLAARLAGVRQVVHTEHDAWHLEDCRRRSLQRTILTLVRPQLVADAERVAHNMRRHLGDRRIHVIRNGIDTRRFRPGDKLLARRQLELPTGVPLIGCSGRLEAVKGQDVLLDAVAMLDRDVHVALAGDGSLGTQLREQAQKLGIGARTHFLGHIDQMPAFYQALDLFCLPSRNEGLPLSALEAQACGIPAAITDVGGSREALCPETGRLMQPDDPRSMARALTQALQQSSNGSPRHFVLAHADLDNTAQAYMELG